MLFFCLFIYLLLVIGIVWGFIRKKSNVFVCFFLSYLCLYDWILINLSYVFSSVITFFLKSVQEVLAILICLLFFHNIVRCRKIRIESIDKIMLLFILVSLFGVLSSYAFGNSIKSIIQGGRLYITPILIPYLFYRYGLFENIKTKYLNIYVKLLILILLCYGTVQVYSYNGNLSSLWFYNFYDSEPINPIDTATYNFVRNGKLRATAFFVSSIHLSITFAFLCVYSFILKIRGYYFWCFLTILGIELTQTRIGYFLIIIVLGIIYAAKIIPNYSYWIIPIISIVLTVLFLVLNLTVDESAIGRLVQYLTFYSNFSMFGHGLGDELALVHFDSFYLSIFAAFGAFALLYIYVYIKIIALLHHYYCKAYICDEINRKILLYTIYICCTTLYLFAFHYVAGSFPINLLFHFIFISFSLLRVVRNKIC